MASSMLKITLRYIIGLVYVFLVSIRTLFLLLSKRGKLFAKKDRSVPPQCLQNQEYGTHHYLQLEGVRLHYVESGPKDGKLMVMLHGFPDFWYSWRRQIPHFNKLYRVIAVDMRGYGGSSKPTRVADYCLTKLIGDVRQLIQTLGNDKPCVLVAHDWGGGVAWAFTGHYPHLVEKLIILNCPHVGMMMNRIQSNLDQFLRSWYMFFINIPYYAEWFFTLGDTMLVRNIQRGCKPGSFTDEDVEAYKHTFHKQSDLTGPLNYYRACLREYNTPSDYGPKIQNVPVLLLWGIEDKALAKELAELCRPYAEHFQIVPVKDATHWVQLDESDVVNSEIEKFLN